MAFAMAGILAGKRRDAQAKMDNDSSKESDVRMREMEKRFFEAEPVAGVIDQAAVDAVVARLQAEAGFTAGLCEELKKMLEAVPLRFWVVDNSGSMRVKDFVKGQGAKKREHTRWEEMNTVLSFFADFAEALGARTDIHFLNQPGATESGLLDLEEFRALHNHFTGSYGMDQSVKAAFDFYDVNSSKRLSSAELLPALRDLLPMQGQHIDMRTASAILHNFNGNHHGQPVGEAVRLGQLEHLLELDHGRRVGAERGLEGGKVGDGQRGEKRLRRVGG